MDSKGLALQKTGLIFQREWIKENMDDKKLREAIEFTKRRHIGGWADFRRHVYMREKHIDPLIPYSKAPIPPSNWEVPDEYYVAFLMVYRKTSKAEAIKKAAKRRYQS